MIAMQYKIMLPDDYDMDIIRKRVEKNGSKTDGFQDLLFKVYLISENPHTSAGAKEYSSLYLWKNSAGMNKFIFDGFYDNILNSFGWQKINIGVPLRLEINNSLPMARFAVEIEKTIPDTRQMNRIEFSMDANNHMGRVLIYNPDKWKYAEYYFYAMMPETLPTVKVYEILHVST